MVKLKNTVCKLNTCTGCMSCINACPKAAIAINDSIESFNAEIDQSKCINCGLCEKVCPNISTVHLHAPIFWKQGWAEDTIRRNSSSGGAASAFIKSFISFGGYAASCLFENGEFGFSVTNDFEKAKKFAGSKYVKSNPGDIYKQINQLLKQGEKVLFIGLPCQSAAVQNICGEQENLYTVDLICHGTPSPKLLKQFVAENGIDWRSITDIKFREGEYFGLESNGVRFTPRRVQDSYLRVFLHSVDYTENCYSCRYATLDRVSDITIGDAWGQLADTVTGGVSLILCQTEKGRQLVEAAGLYLEDVDLGKAVEANQQLNHPSNKHSGRKKFFRAIKKGRSFRWATVIVFPKESIKLSIKTGLIKINVIKDASEGSKEAHQK